MLVENTLFGIKDKVEIAIKQLKELEPEEGYYLAFSGGKDSVVIKKLAEVACVKFDAHYSVTTIDPPDLIKFINRYHKDVIREKPKTSLLKRMVERGVPPTRIIRWCCAEFKENGGANRFVITGVRGAESSKRAKRKNIEFCYRGTGKRYLNLIINWSDSDVWEFIKKYDVPYCKLYDEGWKRIGCLMCPMSRKRRLIEAEKYPHMKKTFIKYFELLYQKRLADGKDVSRWADGVDMFNQWIGDNTDKSKESADQTIMFE